MSDDPNGQRYSRQTILKEVGLDGQQALAKARVLCVGAGGLGSPTLLYLAAAGVGQLGIIDGDIVDVSNLQRQILYGNADAGALKAAVAQKRLTAQNPAIKIKTYPVNLDAANAGEIISEYDLVIDGTDNFAAKFLINDTCYSLGCPWIYASVTQWEGQVCAFDSKSGSCYRCLYPTSPTAPVGNCVENGVIGATVGVVGSWQAVLAVQALLPQAKIQWGTLQVINTLNLEQMRLQIPKRPGCSVCSKMPDEIIEKASHLAATPADSANVTVASAPSVLLSPQEVCDGLENCVSIDVRNHEEWQQGHLPGAYHWPLADIEKGILPTAVIAKAITQNKKPVLYCLGGKRSARAAQILNLAGYGKLFELKGGISAWPQSACPLSHSVSPSS